MQYKNLCSKQKNLHFFENKIANSRLYRQKSSHFVQEQRKTILFSFIFVLISANNTLKKA